MRRIAVTAYEEVREWNRIEVEVPDDLDLSDTEAIDAFLETVYVEGEYHKVHNGYELAIDERHFIDMVELPPAQTTT